MDGGLENFLINSNRSLQRIEIAKHHDIPQTLKVAAFKHLNIMSGSWSCPHSWIQNTHNPYMPVWMSRLYHSMWQSTSTLNPVQQCCGVNFRSF